VTVESPLSGANMDPALATISDFFGRAWRGWWLYFVAPLLAMPAAAFLYKGTARRVYCAKLSTTTIAVASSGASFQRCWPKNGPESADSQ